MFYECGYETILLNSKVLIVSLIVYISYFVCYSISVIIFFKVNNTVKEKVDVVTR